MAGYVAFSPIYACLALIQQPLRRDFVTWETSFLLIRKKQVRGLCFFLVRDFIKKKFPPVMTKESMQEATTSVHRCTIGSYTTNHCFESPRSEHGW